MSEHEGRDWARIRTLLGGWAAVAFVGVVAGVVALWCMAALFVGSAVMLHRIAEWVV